MGEEFQAGICSDNWWSSCSSRSVLLAVGGLSPCSVGIGDLGWPPADDFVDIKPKSQSATTTDSSSHNNSILFPDSTFQMMGFALSSDWNQTDHDNHFLCGGGGGDERNLMNSNGIESYNPSSINGLKQLADEDQNRLNCIINNCSSTSTTTCQGLFPLDSTNLHGYPSSKLLQSLYHDPQPEADQQSHGQAQPLFNTNTFPTNDLSLSSSTPNFPSNYQNHPQSEPAVSAALHFTNNTPFWNPSAAPSSSADIIIPHPILSSSQTQLLPPFKPINSANCEHGSQEPKKGDKNSTTEPPVFKRPRIETPSPLPTFKVRKEKLGDRVTALQQLVSPFGKTDTASVLHEAIEYIKFLHDQVSVLSTPYMKSSNGTPLQHQQVCEERDPDLPKQDLRSRGLCLVPISSTFPVTNATTPDFWTPTFGGTFR